MLQLWHPIILRIIDWEKNHCLAAPHRPLPTLYHNNHIHRPLIFSCVAASCADSASNRNSQPERRCLNFMHPSDLVHCDGRTIFENLLEVSGRVATTVTFPEEKPIRNDKSLWRQLLNSLTNGLNTLLKPHGEYVSLPHAKLHWQYDQESIILLCSNFDNTEHEVHEQRTGERKTKNGPVYKRTRTVLRIACRWITFCIHHLPWRCQGQTTL